MSFWDNLPHPFTVLAPMEDVTDVVFRHVVARASRPDIFMTEFTNVNAYANPMGRWSTAGRLTFTPDEQPIIAQIWGTDPVKFATMATDLKTLGFAGIDINMGCPVKDVVKTGGGSGLIKTPALAREIIRATMTASLPVSVKTRLGFTRIDEYRDWLGALLDEQPANLTVHLRTRKEMSLAPAHYELIPEIIALRDQISPMTKLTINGDIKDWAQIKQLASTYPAIDGYMIGRGIFNNPYCFRRDSYYPNKSELLALFNYHLDQYDKYCQIDPSFLGLSTTATGPNVLHRDFNALKHFVKVYIRDFPAAANVRAEIYACTSTVEIRQVLRDLELGLLFRAKPL